MTALGSGLPDRETTTDEAPRRGIGPQIAAILLIGLVFRLIMAYAFEPLRGSGFANDLDLFRYWADTLAAARPVGLLRQRVVSPTTRPATCTRSGRSGIVGSLVGGIGDLIKLPAILTDVALGLRRVPDGPRPGCHRAPREPSRPRS